MKKLLTLFVVLMAFAGCEDRYRYPCQNPDNFAKPDCQRPKCLFTQMCPDYLVAPILEKQTNVQQQTASEPTPNK